VSEVLLDEVRAGGRIPLIIGRGLTAKAREAQLPARAVLCRSAGRDTGTGFAGAEDGRPRLRPAGRQGARAPTASRR
jgi:aconitate hydratase 2/2-methylisocitrate dehydratase